MIFDILVYFLPYILRSDHQSDGYFGKIFSTNWQIWELKTIGKKYGSLCIYNQVFIFVTSSD